jgi:hypothetical protein
MVYGRFPVALPKERTLPVNQESSKRRKSIPDAGCASAPHLNSRTPIDAWADAVASEIRVFDPHGRRIAHVLRATFDQLYDGQRTGRYRWDQLHQTERDGCGPLVEINLHREFQFGDGDTLDYKIAGAEVDCKYSQTLGGWMIPPEAQGHLCLLVWAADASSCWSMGLVRVTPERLNTGGNRDRKATLNQAGREAITWLFDGAALPPNILLQLDRSEVDRIMALKSGQQRINEIFRVAMGRIVGRGVVATLGQQDDYMKRVRANGGARTVLQREGIVILGQYGSHAAIARALGVPVPGRGDSVSVRLAPASAPGPGVAQIDGALWRVAAASDPCVHAPALPKT